MDLQHLGGYILTQVAESKEVLWLNPLKSPFVLAEMELSVKKEQIDEAAQRLQRFAPFLAKVFPETAPMYGIIESPMVEIEQMRQSLCEKYAVMISGKLLIKLDSDLPVAGSIKARGGIYDVLCHTEQLALAAGILKKDDCYADLVDCKDFFSKFAIHVGSTGNLGLSIGIMSAVIGYRATVHMSRDAKQWKKELLRSYGVTVVEYEGDFSAAVTQGRKLSQADPTSYFVDDENSINLFMGYAVAAFRLKKQLEDMDILVDKHHPLFVYLPCGVGGAPGGITFGLKQVFGDDAHCFFVEPTACPSMLVGMATGLHDEISVHDIGLSGKTHADGLAVSRPSKLVGKIMDGLLSGIFTTADYKLYNYMRELLNTQALFIEPSACAAFAGVVGLEGYHDGRAYIEYHGLTDFMDDATHIVWATGGRLVPQKEREEFLATFL